MSHTTIHPGGREALLTRLAYELLDAHDDTARLVAEDASDQGWQRHLDYLRDLQRSGRELLARAAATPAVRETRTAPHRAPRGA